MGAAALAGPATSGEPDGLPRPTETRKGDMLYRSFGKTGETVSVIGVGGSHIGEVSTEDLAIRIIRTAIDKGINFRDNSWDYKRWNRPGRAPGGEGAARWLPSNSVLNDESGRPHQAGSRPAT